MPTADKKLKILCIHGYRQNAQSFREKTGSFRKALKKSAEFVYITAPHLVPPGNMGRAAWTPVEQDNESKLSALDSNGSQSQQEGEGERGWWFSREDDYFKAVDHSDMVKGYDVSLEQVVNVLEKEDGGFDGIMGFSQGATFVSLLCLKQEQEKRHWFKFAILVAGFKSRLIPHNKFYQGVANIPSLHVIGEDDKVISTDMAEELMSFFSDPRRISHPGGHYVPASSAQKQGYIQFLEEMKQLFC